MIWHYNPRDNFALPHGKILSTNKCKYFIVIKLHRNIFVRFMG